MKIAYCSDLHLEFFISKSRQTRVIDGPIIMPKLYPSLENTENADVLILAGDICNIQQFMHGLCDDFFQHISEQYKEVIWVFGNHEYYSSSLTDTTTLKVANMIDKEYNNIYATHRGILEYNGVTFLCGTLWTDYDRGNPLVMVECQVGMPDYSTINQTDLCFDNEKLTTNYVLSEHRKTVGMIEDYLSNVLESGDSPSIVCVTHHAPSFRSILPKFSRSSLNPAFASDLEYLTCITPNLKYWIHGHMHDKMNYNLNGCKILCNPHGYIDYEDTTSFKLEYFEV